MTRQGMIEGLARLRAADARDPVDNAVMALAALTPEQMRMAADRFNRIFEKVRNVPAIHMGDKAQPEGQG